MKIMKRGMFGKLIECEHLEEEGVIEIRLPLNEYQYLENKIALLKDKCDKLDKKYWDERIRVDKQGQIYYEEYQSQIRKMDQKYTTKWAELDEKKRLQIAEISEKCFALENEVKFLQYKVNEGEKLNANLKRICRERSNADRSISPKKAHDGYIVLAINQCIERIDYSTAPCIGWKTRIQTPYESSITYSAVHHTIENEIMGEGNGILPEIGCFEIDMNTGNVLENYRSGKCICYKLMYNANFRSGFWEIDLWTTGELTVPEHRRVQNSN